MNYFRPFNGLHRPSQLGAVYDTHSAAIVSIPNGLPQAIPTTSCPLKPNTNVSFQSPTGFRGHPNNDTMLAQQQAVLVSIPNGLQRPSQLDKVNLFSWSNLVTVSIPNGLPRPSQLSVVMLAVNRHRSSFNPQRASAAIPTSDPTSRDVEFAMRFQSPTGFRGHPNVI